MGKRSFNGWNQPLWPYIHENPRRSKYKTKVMISRILPNWPSRKVRLSGFYKSREQRLYPNKSCSFQRSPGLFLLQSGKTITESQNLSSYPKGSTHSVHIYIRYDEVVVTFLYLNRSGTSTSGGVYPKVSWPEHPETGGSAKVYTLQSTILTYHRTQSTRHWRRLTLLETRKLIFD